MHGIGQHECEMREEEHCSRIALVAPSRTGALNSTGPTTSKVRPSALREKVTLNAYRFESTPLLVAVQLTPRGG